MGWKMTKFVEKNNQRFIWSKKNLTILVTAKMLKIKILKKNSFSDSVNFNKCENNDLF